MSSCDVQLIWGCTSRNRQSEKIAISTDHPSAAQGRLVNHESTDSNPQPRLEEAEGLGCGRVDSRSIECKVEVPLESVVVEQTAVS